MPVARRLDWEGAAKRDYVHRQGSVPAWADLPKPKSQQTRPEQTKTGARLKAKAKERCAPILQQFAKLPVEERAASVETYRERIKRACEEVRRSVPPSRARFTTVIDVVERSSLLRLKPTAP